MKTRLKLLKLLIVVCSFATMAAFGQTNYTWISNGGGILTATANWNPAALPNGNNGLGDGFQDNAVWSGVATGLITITNTPATLPNTGFGTFGVNLVLTAGQVNDVQFISSVVGGSSGQIGLNHITNNSANSAIIMGDFNTPSSLFRLTGRPAGATHFYINNSAASAVINPSVEWQAGGGTAYTMVFGGTTGNWIVRSSLRNNNGSGGTAIVKEGPGTMSWTNGTAHAANDPLNVVTVNAGKLLIQSAGLFPAAGAGNPITINGGTFEFDAGAQSDTISRALTGASPGVFNMKSGTLTLSSGNGTFSGSITLSGGTVIVTGTETEFASGPLGLGSTISFGGGTLGFSVNNIYDYSGRFSAAASQAYSIDTGGQNVIFTNAAGLTSAGGTLAKLGSGTLTLAGPSTYSGLTTVSVGKLAFQGTKSGTGSISVSDSAALGITATATQVTPGTLTLGTSAGVTLEFENVNSTTTAPLAPSTLASAGTSIINVNSGPLTPGNSYPLLSWTTGSAPSVSLGILNGFIGTLSTNANSIRLNVTATAFTWTGNNNGNWDLSTANNWNQNGGPVVFANGGPAFFDDTSTRTNVTVNALVQPTTVTVNPTLNPYTITSSGGNNIGGSASLTKSGSGSLALAGGANTYTGVTAISGGILSVGVLANGGAASDIGSSSSSATNLVLNGGALQYTGAGATIDRLFTLSTASGTIDSSGSGALNLNNGGSLGYSGNGPRGLTLTGTDPNDNTFAAPLANNGGASSLTKSGTGKWVLTANSAYSGVTTIANGTLQVGAGGGSGSLGSGNVVDNGSLIFNRTGSLTVGGIVSGTGSVTKDGSGTVILANNNSYTGGTTISAGTLQVGNGGGTGGLALNGQIANEGTIIFNSTANLTLSGNISGNGQLVKRGSGLLILRGGGVNYSYNGGTTIDAGARLQMFSGNESQFTGTGNITNNGSLIFVRQDAGVAFITQSIRGTGDVTKEGNNDLAGDVTLTGTNTYTGGTIIRSGGFILGDGVNPGFGSLNGTVTFANSAISTLPDRYLNFNRPDDFAFNGPILGAVTNIGNAVGQVALGNAGRVIKNGAGIMTLNGVNTYPAGTTINSGTLLLNGTNNGSGTVTVNASATFGGTGRVGDSVNVTFGGFLAPGASIGTLTIVSNLTIAGDLVFEVNRSLAQSNDIVVVGGTLNNTGAGTLTVANLGPALAVGNKFTLFSKPMVSGSAITVTGGGVSWSNDLEVDGSITVSSLTPAPTLSFTRNGNNLDFSWADPTFKLQAQTNSLAVGISSNWVDYPGGGTSPVSVPIDAAQGTVFFRLAPTP